MFKDFVMRYEKYFTLHNFLFIQHQQKSKTLYVPGTGKEQSYCKVWSREKLTKTFGQPPRAPKRRPGGQNGLPPQIVRGRASPLVGRDQGVLNPRHTVTEGDHDDDDSFPLLRWCSERSISADWAPWPAAAC